MAQQELLTKTDYAAIGAEISHEKAADYIQDYKNAFPQGPVGFSIGRNIVEKILAQPGCVGMRFHFALNDAGQQSLVYYGMDVNGKDLVKYTMVKENGTIVNEDAIAADFITIIPWFR